jgi:tRNA (cmo5U34)-methyltransferase
MLGEKMKKDATFKWDNTEFVEFYRNSANVIMVERQRSIKIILEILAVHFSNLTGLHILDLGCGDGVIAKHIQEKFHDNNFCLIDASEEMLRKAKENLGAVNVSCQHLSFEDYIENQSEDSKYDIVVSANAIHHLDFVQKTKLFIQIYKALKYGGIFINVDPVHPTSSYSEKIQFEIWRNWMNEKLENNGHVEEIGKFDNIPLVYRNNLENKPSGLFDQMQALSQCGFRDVDCFYKYSIFAVFGGTK